MGDRLVTDTMLSDMRRLQDVTRLLKELSPYPAQMLAHYIELFKENQRSRKPRIGSRNFLWNMWALQSLMVDPDMRHGPLLNYIDPTGSKQFFEDLLDYTKRYYSKPSHKMDVFWRVSILHALAILGDLIARLHPDLNDRWKSVCSNWNESKVNDIVEIANKKVAKPLGWYRSFWVHQAIRNPESSAKGKLNIYGKEKAWTQLSNQLANYACGSASFNRMELAVAAATAWTFDSEICSESEDNSRLLAKAVEICLSESDGYLAKRLIQKTDDYGEIHNLPWEEVFIALALPAHYTPNSLNAVDQILQYVKDRMTHGPYGGIGLAEESYEGFPKSADYFSNYAITLLARIRGILKAKLRLQLVEKVQSLGPHYIIYPNDRSGGGITFHKMAETCEGTVKHLSDRLPTNQKDFEDRLETFNTVLLFGPPGTGKTTVVQAFVNYFQELKISTTSLENWEDRSWLGVTLTPGMFLVEDSFAKILEQIRTVFEILRNLDHCVLFFDEGEELASRRETEDVSFGRMFTAAMLQHLSEVKKGHCVHVMATNFIDKMDDAAVRKGRFAIRKGLGWIDTAALPKLVMTEFSRADNTAQRILVTELEERTIGEIMDIKNILEHPGKDYDADHVKNVLDKWKRYLSEDVIHEHKHQLNKYDDSWSG